MIKIFHIISHFELGGAEKVAINIAKSVSPNFEHHIYEVIRGDSEYSISMLQKLKEENIIYHRSHIKNKKLAIILFPLFFLIKCLKNPPNIIHTHTEVPDLSIYLFSKISILFKIYPKYIRTIHNNQLWNKWEWVGNYVERFFIKHKCNVAISISTKESYIKKYHDYKIPIIQNGAEKSNQIPFHLIKKNKINILFSGRLVEQKGIYELISVIKALKDDNQFHFHIVGSGPMEGIILKELEKIENISKYERIFNINQYLSSFDYLFMPSNFEGLSLMAIEASLNGLPNIINSCSGLKEILPPEWPLKVVNNSIDDYLVIFKETIHNIDRKDLIKMAYNYAIDNFSIYNMQINYEELYLKKLKQDEK